MNIPKDNFVFIAGPCVLENKETSFNIAASLISIVEKLEKIVPVTFVFKGSFDKANRSDIDSFRGPGFEKGMGILESVKKEFNCNITTDIHEVQQAEKIATIADIIQIPAFLSRQTDLLLATAKTGKIVNVKKGQFMSPTDIPNIIKKIRTESKQEVFITERGASFGYKNLVVDMTSFVNMKRNNEAQIIFDASHTAPAWPDKRSYIPSLACAAAATGSLNGMFMEVYDEPDKALCDGPNSVKLSEVEKIMEKVLKIWRIAREAE